MAVDETMTEIERLVDTMCNRIDGIKAIILVTPEGLPLYSQGTETINLEEKIFAVISEAVLDLSDRVLLETGDTDPMETCIIKGTTHTFLAIAWVLEQ